MGMDLSHGGHLTHGSRVNFSGMLYNFVPYGVDPSTETIDYVALEKKAKEVKPRLIVGGASAYPRFIDFERMRHICDEVGAYFMVDMAHIAGLVAAGVHPSPVPVSYTHLDVYKRQWLNRTLRFTAIRKTKKLNKSITSHSLRILNPE